MEDVLRILAVLALVGLNAFFVIGEYAVVTARRSGLTGAAEAGSARARAALRLMDDPVRVISTVQVGITALGILTGAVGQDLIRDVLGGGLPDPVPFLLAFAIITYLSVVLGELVPKALTLDRAERLAMVVARPIELISILVRPIVWVLERSAALLLKPFGVREVVAGEGVESAEELRALVDEAEGAGVIPRDQEELLHNVFDLSGQDVRNVMVPDGDIVWLDASLDPGAALDELLSSPYSRAPVGRGSLDRLAGIVHVRELAAALRAGDVAEIGDVARAVPVVPTNKDLAELLGELREGRHSAAVVADEYGATVGLVTLEDVLESLVGSIEDEFDVPTAGIEREDDGSARLAGTVSVDDANTALDLALPDEGVHTVAGLVFGRLGRRPEVGDEVVVGGRTLVVDELDGLRITRVRVAAP